MGMTRYYPDGRITLSVRVCPDTYDGLRAAADDMGCTLQDAILGAILLEYGIHLYSPDALACPITMDEICKDSDKRLRTLARLAGPLYHPPTWYADRLKDGTIIDCLDAQLTLARLALSDYAQSYTPTP